MGTVSTLILVQYINKYISHQSYTVQLTILIIIKLTLAEIKLNNTNTTIQFMTFMIPVCHLYQKEIDLFLISKAN